MYSTENLKTFTIKKADLAVQIPKAKEVLPIASTIGKLAKYLQNIEPQLYLQRILILANSNKKVDFEDCLAKYELCVVAPSMFDNNGFMRTPKKADLADFLVSEDCKTDYNTMKQKIQSGEMKVVLDGGALLHIVQWTKGTTFSDIKHNYLGHIKNLVDNTIDKDDVHIVFDGYLTSSTKDHCKLKRCPFKSMKQSVEPGQKLGCKKQVFLANPENKQDVISIFYLTLILLRLFQQHYCYNVTGQSQESEGFCKPARIKEVHSKLHSFHASLCTLTATHLTLIYVCTYIRLSVPLGCLIKQAGIKIHTILNMWETLGIEPMTSGLTSLYHISSSTN